MNDTKSRYHLAKIVISEKIEITRVWLKLSILVAATVFERWLWLSWCHVICDWLIMSYNIRFRLVL